MRTFLRRTAIGGFCAFLIALLSFGPFALAQTADPAKTAQLEAELAAVNEEIKALNGTITGLKSEGQSLDRDIKLLNANINKANLNIKAKNLQIAKLGDGIKEKTRTVRTLGERIERERQSLAQLIRKTNELDQASFAEMMLSNEDLSDFFLDLDSFAAIRPGLKNSSDNLKSARTENEAAQKALEERQSAEVDAKADLEANKRQVQANEQEKKRLVSIT